MIKKQKAQSHFFGEFQIMYDHSVVDVDCN